MKPNGHKICKEWLSEDPIQALSLEWMQGEVHISQGTEAVIRVTQRGLLFSQELDVLKLKLVMVSYISSMDENKLFRWA
ncbi:hypothetical protein [Paenibacillus sp. 1A_MP2]|uniref:hypothetical protein n=1 Tax=Paenibacillus sp. 1A_MP2 TaxID=3457495 RepID=UPI003FCD5357